MSEKPQSLAAAAVGVLATADAAATSCFATAVQS